MTATDHIAEAETYIHKTKTKTKQMAQKHKITSYNICIVKKEGKWVRDFWSKVVECQKQIGVGANQKN